MQLRVTRPGFLEGIRALKASQGIANYDVNRMATRQEMRAFVCGQCHVEYYFKGPEKRLTYPWDKGLKADDILSLLPGERLPRLGARRIRRAGAQGAASRVRDVEPGHPCAIRRDLRGLPHALPARGRAEDQRPSRAQPAAQHQPRLPDVPPMVGGGAARARVHDSGPDLPDAQPRDGRAGGADRRHQGGARPAARRTSSWRRARDEQRQAQFLLDFIEAENSMGFHAPQEAMRVLALSIDHTRKGQLAVRAR